jgi:hypothetical protein
MAQQTPRATNSGITVKTHHELPQITEKDAPEKAAQVISDADRGIQTTVVAGNGTVRTVIGLNGIRYLPDPDPDPLDEIMRLALDTARSDRK